LLYLYLKTSGFEVKIDIKMENFNSNQPIKRIQILLFLPKNAV